MAKRVDFSYHTAAMYFLFSLGGSVFLTGTAGLVSILLAAISGVLTALLPKPNLKIYGFVIALISVLSFVYTLYNSVEFLKTTQLSGSYVFSVAFIFCFVSVLYSKSRLTVRLKLCLAAFVFVAFCVVFLFAMALPQAETEKIKYVKLFDFPDFFKLYVLFFLPVAVLPYGRKAERTAGIFAGGLLLILFSLLSVITLGKTAHTLTYPALSVASTENIGRVFTRLDSLFWAVFYFSSLIRCGECLKSVKNATFVYK